MARREIWVDPTDDPELIEQSRELGYLGELAFLKDVAAATKALIPNRPMPIEEWAPQFAFIPASKTTRGGRAKLTPIQRGAVRLLQRFGTEIVYLLKCPRLGASTLTALLLLYYACWEQCDVLLYERSEKTAQVFSKDKLMPIIRASTKLKKLLRPDGKTGEQDTWDNRELMNGASVKHRSIHNDDSFKGIRGRFIAGEEAGDSDWHAGEGSTEGSKIDRMIRRGQEFADGRVFMSGTPTILGKCLISAGYEASDKHVFKMDCPHCGHRQSFLPNVLRVTEPGERAGPGIRYVVSDDGKYESWYECANEVCSVSRIDEEWKSSMMEGGDFESITTRADVDRRKIGLHVWMAYSEDPGATWKHIAEEHHLKFTLGTAEERKTFVNMFLGLPYDATPTATMSPMELEAKTETWHDADGVLVDAPAWAEALFASVDYQRGYIDDPDRPPRLEMFIHAVGKNQRRAVVDYRVISREEVWSDITHQVEREPIRPFSVQSAEQVWDALRKEWITEDGRKLRIKRCFVDNGDASEIANPFCLLPMSIKLGIVPIAGDRADRGRGRRPLLPESTDLRISKKSKRRYLYLGTQAGKDHIADTLTIPAPAPQSWVFASHLPRSFYEGLLAERLNEKTNRWERISSSNTGEPWDTMIYSYAAERYEMRKNGRLKKLIDTKDPVAAEKALLAQAESRLAQEKRVVGFSTPVDPPSPEPVLDPPDTCASSQTTVPIDDTPPSDGPRFRILRRRKGGDTPADDRREASERVKRIAAKNRSSGIRW